MARDNLCPFCGEYDRTKAWHLATPTMEPCGKPECLEAFKAWEKRVDAIVRRAVNGED